MENVISYKIPRFRFFILTVKMDFLFFKVFIFLYYINMVIMWVDYPLRKLVVGVYVADFIKKVKMESAASTS